MQKVGIVHDATGELSKWTAAATHFQISVRLLKMVARLSSEKGGIEARKVEGALVDWTREERRWLDTATVWLVRRIVDRELQPMAELPQINISDLPPL
jgi:hypothetical protein